MKRAKKKQRQADVINGFTRQTWLYSKVIKDHFFHPRNLLLKDPAPDEFDCEGIIGSPACGDVMRVWLKIDKDKIIDLKWRTFGCASAIAATSMLSVMVTEGNGMKLDKAMKIKPQDIIKRLGGLPDRKIHCSVLSHKALRTAINNWFKKTNQFKRIVPDGSRIIDPYTKVTEADVEKAVLDGALTLEDLQKKTKVGIGYPQCLPEVEQLIHFYKEKHFGS